ncbi:hypothetical protein L3X38_025136 [Prunus dulcis]|uniref:Uncharacterized protein n=1 Tax=Prunus dulcis TaxID=3755 RepID=A0AAD4Z7P7_PRUDU|nr:hypothetical protein L3X38_025136 [Prunus dulcis]
MLPRILKAERHDVITVQPPVCNECRMLVIGKVHKYMVISRIGVHETEQFVTGGGVHKLVDPGQQEAVLRTGLIQVSIVLAHPPPALSLPNHY